MFQNNFKVQISANKAVTVGPSVNLIFSNPCAVRIEYIKLTNGGNDSTDSVNYIAKESGEPRKSHIL